MFTIKEFVEPKTLGQAYDLLISKKNNTLIGGSAFLRLGSKKIHTAIDLSSLDLDYIKDSNDYIEIGAFTSLREIETNPLVMNYYNGVISKSVKDIIGIQLRNIVTIGASVFSRYGFSDVIPVLLALNTEVELYKSGRMTLNQFLEKKYEKDILTKILIKKGLGKASYQNLRNSASDYPVLNAAVSNLDDKWTITVGARPQRATIAKKASEEMSKDPSLENLENVLNIAVEELVFGTNTMASAEYRKAICKTLIKRGIKEVAQWK